MVIRILFVLFCILTCFSCNKKKSQTIVLEPEENTDPFRLKGMHVTSLDSILQGKDRNADIIFLYNFYDCGSCVDSGFQLIDLFNSLMRSLQAVERMNQLSNG